jgi:acetoin utilization deacetylase AcuC-like enzyme
VLDFANCVYEHHAFKEKGEGFCVFNDIAIAANYLIHSSKFNNILIVDLDVHQGNGSAAIFNGHGQVFTFSMHGAKNYPFRKEASHLDIGLPDGTEDEAYLKILFNILPRLIDQHQPELIFYQAGVDILRTDRLGRLSVSREGCRKRDKYVMEMCKKNKIKDKYCTINSIFFGLLLSLIMIFNKINILLK